MSEQRIGSIDKKRHFDALTGLRGIAVILVVWFHFWQQSWMSPYVNIADKFINLTFIPATGFMGVEVFLVLAAFGLFYPYVLQIFEGVSRGNLRRYAYRRAIKILPSYYLMLVLVCIIGQGTPYMQGKNWWHVLRHFLLVNNLSKDTLFGSVNSVSWFVGLQVQFYLIFPVIALAFQKRPLLTYLLLQAIGILFRLFVYNYEYQNLSYLFNQLPGYIDMYANGMMAAYLVGLFRNKKERMSKLKIFFTLTSVTAILLYGALMKYMYSNTGLGSIQDYQLLLRPYFGWILVILVVSTVFAFKGWQLVLSNPFTRFMAGISYNLYLWHQWIAVEIRVWEWIPSTNPDPHYDPRWKINYSLVITLISLVVAVFFTYCFERPLQKKGLRRYCMDIIYFFPKMIAIFKKSSGEEPRKEERE